MMKIIFLDIDGVCNNDSFLKSQYVSISPKEMEDEPSNYLDNNNIVHLNSVCEKTGANIVISSSWRKLLSLDEIKDALAKKGFLYKDSIIDVTPEFIGTTKRLERGDEIKSWLKENPVEGFVIIDDDDDMGSLFPHLIKTDFLFGLQEKHISPAIYILNKEL